MRKCVLLLAGLAVATIVVPASASDLTFFFDVRGTAAEITAPTSVTIIRGQALFAKKKTNIYALGTRAGNGGGAVLICRVLDLAVRQLTDVRGAAAVSCVLFRILAVAFGGRCCGSRHVV